jgi:O-antigen/teichoic acid export membrane protein
MTSKQNRVGESSKFSLEQLNLRDRLTFLFKDSVIYGGATAISRLFSLITFPLLARNLSVAEYGTLDLFLVMSGFLTTFLIFGLDSAVVRYFYEYDTVDQRRQLISQSLVLQMLVLALATIVLYFASGFVLANISPTGDANLFYRIVLAQVPFMVVISFAQGILKWTFSRQMFLIMSIGYAAVQALMLIPVVTLFGASIRTVLIVNLVANVLFAVLGLYFVRQWLTRPRGWGHLRELIQFALPLGVICTAGAFTPLLERSMIERLLGADQLGLYSAGSKVAMLLALIVGSFQTAWGPFSTSIYKEQNAVETYNLVLKLYCFLICVAVMVLEIASPSLIELLATQRYGQASVVVFPLALAAGVQSVSWITEIGINFSKRSGLSLYSHTIYICGLILLMVILIPMFGLVGVAFSVLGAQVMRSLFASWLAQRAHPLRWTYTPVFVMFALTLASWLVTQVIESRFGFWSASITYCIFLALFLTYFWFFLLGATGRSWLVNFLASIARRVGRA